MIRDVLVKWILLLNCMYIVLISSIFNESIYPLIRCIFVLLLVFLFFPIIKYNNLLKRLVKISKYKDLFYANAVITEVKENTLTIEFDDAIMEGFNSKVDIDFNVKTLTSNHTKVFIAGSDIIYYQFIVGGGYFYDWIKP